MIRDVQPIALRRVQAHLVLEPEHATVLRLDVPASFALRRGEGEDAELVRTVGEAR